MASAVPSGAVKASGVPHLLQKPRFTWFDERNVLMRPRVHSSRAPRTETSGA